MATLTRYKYQAFISYKREDDKWASWLQRKLEHYKMPVVVKRSDDSLPSYVRPVFKDTTDLSGGLLEKAIDEALIQSRYLIVICSPRAAKSPWVCKEVQHFIDSGREEFIIPFIIEGLPNSSNISTECFPKNLRELTGSRELLGININELGRDAAMVKVVARMFRLEFDTLWRRFEKDKRRKLYLWLSLAMLLVMTAVSVAGVILKKNADLNRQYELIEEQNSKLDSTNVLITKTNDSLAIQHSRLLQANDDLNRQKQLLNLEYENVRRANREMKINNARYISGQIRSLTDDGHVYDAHRLSGEIYKRMMDEGLDVPEVESAMKYSFSARPSFVTWDNDIEPCTYIPVKTFDADRYNCEYAVFENDASQLMIYGSTGFWGIFDTRTGQMVTDNSMNMNQNGLKLSEVTFSRSNRYAAIVVSQGSGNDVKEFIIVADNTAGEYCTYENNFYYGVEHMTFSPDERYLAYTCSLGIGAYTVIDVQEGKVIVNKDLDDSMLVSSLIFSSDSKRLYLAGVFEDALVYADILTDKVYKVTYKKNDNSEPVNYNKVLCAGNGKLYASSGNEFSIINEADMKVEKTISGHDGMISSASLCSDKLLATGDDDGYICVWDLESVLFPIQKQKLHDDSIVHIDFDDSGDWILTCSRDHSAKLLGKFRYLEPYDYAYVAGFNTVTYTDTATVVIAKKDSICEMSLADGNVLWETPKPEGSVNKVACYNGSELIAVPAADSTILLYRKGVIDAVLQGHEDGVDDLSFNHDGTRLASVTSSDDKLIIWDIANKRIERILDAASSIDSGVMYSKDGKYLLLYAEGEVRLYETSRWSDTSMKVTSTRIKSAAIGPNGTTVLICGENQEIMIWDLVNGKSLMTTRWQKTISGAAFSHSGRYIAATSEDGWIKVWNASTGDSVLEYHVSEGPCMNPQFKIDDTGLLCEDYVGFYEVGLYDTQIYVDYINNTYGSYPLSSDELKRFYLE